MHGKKKLLCSISHDLLLSFFFSSGCRCCSFYLNILYEDRILWQIMFGWKVKSLFKKLLKYTCRWRRRSLLLNMEYIDYIVHCTWLCQTKSFYFPDYIYFGSVYAYNDGILVQSFNCPKGWNIKNTTECKRIMVILAVTCHILLYVQYIRQYG